MKIVILGKGGQGVIFFSRIIAQAAINRGLSVCSTEIKGMAKKGGTVEIQMKIGQGMCGLVKKGSADLVILLSDDLIDYAKSFGNNVFTFKNDEIQAALEKVSMRFINTFLLGVFVKRAKFFDSEDFIKILDEENRKSFLKGYEYVQS